ncbi:hypothetical protein BJ085DRAFT_31922 [Dimargaris cristalligena]|uniref:Thioredoxin domain-containing protein n=1 Tax=Dimargaris cristalligena TaxID=215637 RepID=A0A4P9ZPM6_9FUNG|nr:hypothetical protein BJ085DRAFT_31922 [Dimargaris cristalligena]|eukprot:RKP34641.1 hypothetical protein BJ085DRAFT_31922 [Dimargaris cristalligena]
MGRYHLGEYSSYDQLEYLIQSDEKVIVLVYSDNDSQSGEARDEVSRLSDQYYGVGFVFVDVDEQPNIYSSLGYPSYPSVLAYQDGSPVYVSGHYDSVENEFLHGCC